MKMTIGQNPSRFTTRKLSIPRLTSRIFGGCGTWKISCVTAIQPRCYWILNSWCWTSNEMISRSRNPEKKYSRILNAFLEDFFFFVVSLTCHNRMPHYMSTCASPIFHSHTCEKWDHDQLLSFPHNIRTVSLDRSSAATREMTIEMHARPVDRCSIAGGSHVPGLRFPCCLPSLSNLHSVQAVNRSK